MRQTANQYAAKVRAELPEPGDTPISHLRHVVAAFADEDADKMPINATMGIYPDHEKTGLTWGDLRALLAIVAPDVDACGCPVRPAPQIRGCDADTLVEHRPECTAQDQLV